MARTRRAKDGSLRRLAQAAAFEWSRGKCDRDNPAEEVRLCWSIARGLLPDLSPAATAWMREQLPMEWREIVAQPVDVGEELQAAIVAALTDGSAVSMDPLASFYEVFLQASDPAHRRKRGVFYTPLPMVQWIVRRVDQLLREEFQLERGWLDDITWKQATDAGVVRQIPAGMDEDLPLVRVIDPALGAGLFLTEIVRYAREQVSERDAWNALVPALLNRLGGIEIAPAAACLGVARMAATLQATGFDFATPSRFHLKIGDALAEPIRPAWSIIVGNPPFAGISANKHEWLHALLRGRGPAGEPRANYFDIAGQPLGERKHWLLDDYVQFLRIAHEQVETLDLGIVALVTNHGYLDNASFRGLREKLSRTFPRMTVVDLHGNAKRRERTPTDERDENVFNIEQGVAIGVFCRPPQSEDAERRIERRDLWGTVAQKWGAMASDDEGDVVRLHTPGQAFHVMVKTACPFYDAGWSIDAAMPLNSTAPVTARDYFVVARTMEELAERCRDFCDESISDDEIRVRYFTRTRSRRYPPGDTRGWKLSEARKRMRAVDWQTLVRPVLYRPFDWRFVLWADWLIDWPRGEVTQHLHGSDNVVLITRRQSPPGSRWNYVWATDGLTLDGVIRSDNRGSESLFPLWLTRDGRQVANFAPAFVSSMEQAIGATVDPSSLFGYIYGLLHAPSYQQRYAAQLAADFPRIVPPEDLDSFQQLAAVGQLLLAIHLGRESWNMPVFAGETPCFIAAGFPRHRDERLYLNPKDYFDGVSARAAAWHVGCHRVAFKLLKDQRGRALSAADIASAARALAALEQCARYDTDTSISSCSPRATSL